MIWYKRLPLPGVAEPPIKIEYDIRKHQLHVRCACSFWWMIDLREHSGETTYMCPASCGRGVAVGGVK